MVDDKQIVLIVGAGGREHALAWKLSQSSVVQHIYVCPGNGGTVGLERTTNVDVPLGNNFKSLVAFAIEKEVSALYLSICAIIHRSTQVTLVVPGPEQPLVDGIETAFRKGAICLAVFLFPFLPLTLAVQLEYQYLDHRLVQRVWKAPRRSPRRSCPDTESRQQVTMSSRTRSSRKRCYSSKRVVSKLCSRLMGLLPERVS